MTAEKIKVRVRDDPATHEVNVVAFSEASKVFADMIQLTDDGAKSDEIRLDISPEIFPHVVEFVERRHSKVTCGHPDHGEIEDNDMKVMCMLDKAFIRKFSSREVLLLSQAARYLEIGSLERVCLKTMMYRMEGQTAGTMRKELSLRNDFSNYEENMVRKENEWCLDLNTMKF